MPDTISNQPTIGMDFFPTLLELAGVGRKSVEPLDGTSLVQTLRSTDHVFPRTLGWHFPHYHESRWTPGSALRKGDWKIIKRYETESLELYHLGSDIGERNELSLVYPEKLNEMKSELERWLGKLGAELPISSGN